MDIEENHSTPRQSVGICTVSFDRHDPGVIGQFSLSKLQEAVEEMKKMTHKDECFIRFGTAAYDESSQYDGHDTLLFLSEFATDRMGVVCCPRNEKVDPANLVLNSKENKVVE